MLEDQLKQHAASLGFDLCGIATAGPADHFERYKEWVDRGYAGDMSFLTDRPELRRSPTSIVPDVRSVIMLGMTYGPGTDDPPGTGRIARYAQGPDYHQFLWRRLDGLLEWLQRQVPSCNGRTVVDSAPLLERDFARRAGLGWFGKNTLLINKRLGSFLFLGAVLVDIDLRPDRPHESAHCGSCTACLDACPTHAFPEPGWLDARRCISYLTIELRKPIPEEIRPGVGDWLFGCDVCQDVCPWNRKLGRGSIFPPAGDYEPLDARELLAMDESQFRQRFRGTPMFRAKRRGLLRNAAIVLGNTGGVPDIPLLERACGDGEPLIREAAQWAIAQIKRRAADGGELGHADPPTATR